MGNVLGKGVRFIRDKPLMLDAYGVPVHGGNQIRFKIYSYKSYQFEAAEHNTYIVNTEAVARWVRENYPSMNDKYDEGDCENEPEIGAPRYVHLGVGEAMRYCGIKLIILHQGDTFGDYSDAANYRVTMQTVRNNTHHEEE